MPGEPAMSHDLKEGDLVEFTSLRGKVLKVHPSGSTDILFEGSTTTPITINAGVLSQAKITKLEPELKVGRAILKRAGIKGRVVHVEGDEAWFSYDDGGDVVVKAKLLRNIPEDQS